ncbi:hypothetical protein ABMA27_014384 [Loxostege sticticalis]|uniref:ATP-dependent DNA helicase n=1 Tax=Loxostege sticticalis TaxID=481309 RepID=A0ABR3I8Q9_LOXSC
MKKRSRPAVLRTRYYTADSDPEAYYYSLLVTHCPFRSESELLEGYDNAKDAFLAKRGLLRPLHSRYDNELLSRWENEIQDALRRLAAEQAADLCANVSVTNHQTSILQPPFHDIVIQEDDFEDNVVVNTMSDEDFLRGVNSLNHDQKQLFAKVSDKLRTNTTNDQQRTLLMFITGGAGSGKSFTLKLLVEQIRRLSSNTSVTITAPTGVAARLVGGCTLHSTFVLPIEKGQTVTLRPLTGDRLQRERNKWRNIEWVIIDEVSMVPYSTLRNIHLRLQELKQNDRVFGGVNVLAFGDLMQLPPVAATLGGAYCFKQPEHLVHEPHLWRMFDFCELSQNMRQANDNTFVDLLNNIRVGKLTLEQLATLDTRKITNETNDYDEIMSERLTLLTKMYTITAIDTSTESKTYGQTPKPEHLPSDPNRTGGIINSIELGIGSRVMLRRNLNVNKGLVNGAMGVVKAFEWPALRRDQLEQGEQPSAVLIQFDDASIKADINGFIRIEPCLTEFDGLRGSGKIQRKMLPLILSWACTVHKLQGCTLDKAVINLGRSLFAKGQAYVALSRVRTIEGLFISALDHNKLLKNPHDSRSLAELDRLRNLPRSS